MKEFEYSAASTLDEAVSLLAARGNRAKILAGGTDVLVQLRETNLEADLVLDVKKIPELMEVRLANSGLSIGASVPCYRLYDDPKIRQQYAGLIDAAEIIGGWQIQSRASIGGNLCNSSPAADSIPMLIAYDVTCHIVGPEGSRTVPVAEFCTAPGKNQLGRGEMLVSLSFPAQPAKSGAHYLRFIPRNEMDIAVVGVGAWLQLDSAGKTIEKARIGLGAVGPTPIFAKEASDWLAGKPATLETFTQAGELARKSAKPISDKRGPAEYRVHLTGVLTKRALAGAAERARG